MAWLRKIDDDVEISDIERERGARPDPGNIFYNTIINGGISQCIQGNYWQTYYDKWKLDVLRNCVGAASGAFNETFCKNIYGNINEKYKFKYALNGPAEQLINLMSDYGLNPNEYKLSKTAKPPLGGLIVWQGEHVAYICDVSSDGNEIVVQQSGYGYDYPAPQFDSSNNEIGSYRWGWRQNTYRRGQNNNWSGSDGYTLGGECLGYIANPAIPHSSLVIPNYALYIWNFLKQQGFTNYAIAGIMGNLYAESGLRPKAVQSDYLQTDPEAYDNEYVNNVDSGIISEYDFVYNGPGGGGFGLAQWTYPDRKQKLYNYAKSLGVSIGNIDMQLDFLMTEIDSGLKESMNNSVSIYDATEIWMVIFERPADQSLTAKDNRAIYSQRFYYWFCNSDNPPIDPDPIYEPYVWIYRDGGFIRAIPYIYSTNGWEKAIPNIKNGTSWIEINERT